MDRFPDDLTEYPYRGVTKHRQMTNAARAAQFAPFSALNGFDTSIAEAARVTESEPVLAEEETERIRVSLTALAAGEPGMLVRTVLFERDPVKSGGMFRFVTGEYEKIDEAGQILRLKGDIRIPFDRIIRLECGDEAF